jgi:hypothetical protein
MGRTAASLLIVLIAGCSPTPKSTTQPDMPEVPATGPILNDDFTIRQPLSDRTEHVLSASTRCEARRMKLFHDKVPDGQEFRAEYGPVIDVPKATADQLKAVLRDGATYQLAMAGCFMPGVQLEFFDGDNRVTCQICFHCRNIHVVVDDKAGKQGNGEPVFSKSGYEQLFKLVASIFPGDEDFIPKAGATK